MPIRRAPPTSTPPVHTGTASRAPVTAKAAGKHKAEQQPAQAQAHDAMTVALRPIAKSDVVVAAEARATSLEQRAIRTTNTDEKRALTRAALEAWMSAADADVTLGASRLHGAQSNAARAAERLGAISVDDGMKRLCEGMARAIEGDIAGATKIFEAALAPGALHTTRDVRSALRTALHRIADGRAAVELDDIAKKLVSARTDLDPRASAAKVAKEAEALIAKHPRQALAFAALAIEAHAAARSPHTAAPGPVPGEANELIALVKHAAHLQSKARVPSVATKALLLAHVARITGNDAGAFAAYRRVGEMAHASEREVSAAQLARVQIAFVRGRPGDVVEDLHALSARGPLERGLVALASASSLPKERALAAIDEALAALPKNARLVDDVAAMQKALLVQKRALQKNAAPPVNAERALDVLGALDAANTARVPLSVLLEQKSAHVGAKLTGDIGALVSLTSTRLSLLDPVPVAQGAQHTSLGGMIAHVVTGQRGDSTRSTHSPLALSLGLDVARAALGSTSTGARTMNERANSAPLGAAPSSTRLAELQAEMNAALTHGAPTNGPATLDEARSRLLAAGWLSHEGTTALTKDGARVSFDTFTIAETPAFHAVLDTTDGEKGRTVHVGKLVFSNEEWSLFENGFESTMKRYQRVLHTKQAGRFEAKDIDDIRTLVSMGRDVDDMPARRAQIAELAARAKKAQSLLNDLVAQGKVPKGAMIFVEGIDAASKTTNGMNLKKVFEDAGFAGSWLSFKGPTAEERQQHWLKRFQAKEPGDNAVFLSDRTFLGDHAYNPTSTTEAMLEKAQDVAQWERDMNAKGVLVLKLLFDPRLEDHAPVEKADDVLERPMVTFGKREARALIARDLLERAVGNGASPEDVQGLEAACMGPGYNDLKSFHEGNDAMGRFRAFADANDAASAVNGMSGNEWVRVGTKERHAGRLRAYDALIEQLEAWGKRT